jgi:ABC-type dipeptide/oligopeptide/nickel transport system permease component
MHPVDEEMKGNKKRRVVMRRQQSFAVRAKRIILPIIALGIGIFVLLTRTIGSAPQDDKRRQFVHLRGGNNKDLVWVHSDSQPFVSGTCLVFISLEGLCLCNYCGYSYTFV